MISRESGLSEVERLFCAGPQITARLIAAAISPKPPMAALLEGKAARMLGVTLEMLEGIPAAA
ncbi:hypothetical protein [Pseudomonas matsuisoli]|uniref:Uncharacterized protein n=1 Tax=Pseudomonas matsuisoli TaxID=1515666 RepID=A0A917Q0N5_9PSED|nr:hypothetical protein [Pseudomonas matsuisoli]GGK05299.1 hypothetical protein GCM10009304_34280 [Pseudomonas matsuisoli]